jgi:hypothetical protein
MPIPLVGIALAIVTTNGIAFADDTRNESPERALVAPRPSRTMAPVWFALAGGGVAIGGLVVGAFGYLPAMSSLRTACPGADCASTPANHQLYDRAQSCAFTADVLVGAGAFATAAGIVWWLVDRSDAANVRVYPSLTVGVGSAAIAAEVRF